MPARWARLLLLALVCASADGRKHRYGHGAPTTPIQSRRSARPAVQREASPVLDPVAEPEDVAEEIDTLESAETDTYSGTQKQRPKRGKQQKKYADGMIDGGIVVVTLWGTSLLF